MVKHFVMFKLKETGNPQEQEKMATQVKKRFMKLPDLISGIKFYEIGINISDSPAAYDLILHSEFENIQELNQYRKHPDHVKAVEDNKAFLTDMKVVDYQI